MQSTGLRAFIGKLSMDISPRPTYVESDAPTALASARSFIRSCREMVAHLPEHRRLVEPVVTPRFVPTCSDELLRGLGELARGDGGGGIDGPVRVQSHMAESEDQVDWVRRERGAEDIDIFDRSNLLTPHTIQAHCTHLPSPSPSHSFTRLQTRQTSIAHCPLSNAYFSPSSSFPLREALERGVKVGLGTDVAGGYSVDVGCAMRMAVVVSRMREGALAGGGGGEGRKAVGWKESVYLATRGGAIALGLPEGSGTFLVGAPFDAQQIDLYDWDVHLGVGPLDFFFDDGEDMDVRGVDEDMVEKWWCIGDTRNRSRVWVQGRPLTLN
ncbi:hypothetical protein AX17_003716 [Amanita inopinata Kibby_2008]|nr:hypothetical protein AX17_003716 [Amanita inopinata Kibby_2008]